MGFDRRDFLKLSVATASTCLTGKQANAASGKQVQTDIGDTFAMLNDSTKCIGCRGCQVACKQRQGLEPAGSNHLYDMPTELNSKNLTLIKLYKDADEHSFVKRQCMHCYEPACVSACLVSALKKDINGIVKYDSDRCIGCRYCMVACPFSVPAYEYESPDPYVVKCDFCEDIITTGGQPQCASVCPSGAIKFGKRADLLKEARERINEAPDLYIDHIYGEKEAGGTSVLYLSGVDFDKLGMDTNLGDKSYPDMTKGFLSSVPLVLTIWPMLLMGAWAFSTKKEETTENQISEGEVQS